MVRLLEVDVTQVEFDPDNKIIWPHKAADSSGPTIDGVLVLHDATKPDRLSLTTKLICRCLHKAGEHFHYKTTNTRV